MLQAVANAQLKAYYVGKRIRLEENLNANASFHALCEKNDMNFIFGAMNYRKYKIVLDFKEEVDPSRCNEIKTDVENILTQIERKEKNNLVVRATETLLSFEKTSPYSQYEIDCRYPNKHQNMVIFYHFRFSLKE